MRYTLLQLRFLDNKFVYSEIKDNQDREKQDISIIGLPNQAFVYCPLGREKLWKKRLYQYVKECLSKQKKLLLKMEKVLNESLPMA